ncbi:hypothetical protein NO135_26220, partial [Clostridioides difficile]|nr:hypothetical protein [Clostridioides difficile]
WVPMLYNVTPYRPIMFPSPNITKLPAPWKSYAFYQYRNDPNIRAFLDSYNGVAQDYLDWFNTLQYPVYI